MSEMRGGGSFYVLYKTRYLVIVFKFWEQVFAAHSYALLHQFAKMLLSIYNTFFLFFSILISLGDALPRSRSRRDGATQYLLGVGKADITSGPVEFNFMGYASLGQIGTGIRQRIYSRAFIIGSTSQSKDKFVYVITDLQSGDTAIRKGVTEGLDKLYPGVYGENVAVGG